jgi:tetratricopeptide (TPR) repeat protein
MKTVAVLNNKGRVRKTTSAVNLATEHRSRTEWRKRADSLNETEDWQGMIDWCLKWTKNEPEKADAWYNLGCAYDELGCEVTAIDAYREAVRIDAENGDAWFRLGENYNKLQSHEDAIEAYRQTIRINPQNASAWYGLGCAYFWLSRYEDAIEAYRKVVGIDPMYANEPVGKLQNIIFVLFSGVFLSLVIARSSFVEHSPRSFF